MKIRFASGAKPCGSTLTAKHPLIESLVTFIRLMAATIWVVFIGLQRGSHARFADENGKATTDIRRAMKFDDSTHAKRFIKQHNLGATSHVEQMTISESDV